jgi:pimeloyl-ACP methyl ester carboxylesterase
MGGFVAMELGTRFPERVKSLILVDGGFPMAAPAGLTREMLPTLFADRLARLEQRWDSVDDYLTFFVENTAPMLDRGDPLLRDNLAHDLRDGKVRLSGAALLSDAANITFDGIEWESVDVPIRFLHAQWSVGPDTPPAYSAELVDLYRDNTVLTQYLEGVDHAGSIMTAKGASATAGLLRAALA